MIWLGIAVVAAVLIVAVGVLARRRTPNDVDPTDVDPLFPMGIALTGAGVALATTVGAVMYALMAAGLIVMGVGAHRTRHHGDG